ncbi:MULTISPECIES: hypothetical protein [Pseudomonas]|uniref:hypothetical protein n=1 Tax=Pseudomonas TaxID=286 RepID=UPI0023603761|nr:MULTISPECIES: hypothetical protein [Pseudomonas]WJV22252.1 hypothetical protein PSR66_21740 [Pseudomonas chlororaphis]
MEWNFLIVDDRPDLAKQTRDILCNPRTLADVPGLVGENNIVCDIVCDFDEAKSKALKIKYDLAILDLRDDASNDDLKGREILDSLREAHFLPVVFYSGFAQKVETLRTPFVEVVVKGDGEVALLRDAVKRIFSTRLPHLIRHIHDQQKEYLWSHIDEFWKNSGPICDPEDLAYLLARRLGNSLKGSSIRNFLQTAQVDADVVHPIEMYVWPPLGGNKQTGDLLKYKERFFVVLNPACDLANNKVDYLIVAECVSLEACSEYLEIQAVKRDNKEPEGSKLGSLKSLISDNRSGKGVQPDRFKFLPETVFMKALVVDFQQISSFGSDSDFFVNAERFATLDTPFAESLLNKFSRYYGRIGTPDIESVKLTRKIVDGIK